MHNESAVATEIIFVVEEDIDGGYCAQALGESIVTQGDDWDNLRVMAREAVRCHFEGRGECPKMIQLHFVHDEFVTL